MGLLDIILVGVLESHISLYQLLYLLTLFIQIMEIILVFFYCFSQVWSNMSGKKGDEGQGNNETPGMLQPTHNMSLLSEEFLFLLFI